MNTFAFGSLSVHFSVAKLFNFPVAIYRKNTPVELYGKDGAYRMLTLDQTNREKFSIYFS